MMSNQAMIVSAFRAARVSALPLASFPGVMPTTLAEAYGVQDAAIAVFPGQVRGWKVAGIVPEYREALGDVRLVGPVFGQTVRLSDGAGVVEFPVFSGGFAAVEAEFIFLLGRDILPGEALDREGVQAAVASLHAGVETAGSPFAGINDFGPLATIADFGNNNGIIVGPELIGWRDAPLETLTSATTINDTVEGTGSAAKVAGGPIAALEFLIGNLGSRGITLHAGDYVSTGMTTGVHMVVAGDTAVFDFAGGIRIASRAITASPA